MRIYTLEFKLVGLPQVEYFETFQAAQYRKDYLLANGVVALMSLCDTKTSTIEIDVASFRIAFIAQ